jgi:hypothetical protein
MADEEDEIMEFSPYQGLVLQNSAPVKNELQAKSLMQTSGRN